MAQSQESKIKQLDFENAKSWDRTYLIRLCKEFDIEDIYKSYDYHMRIRMLPLFVCLNIILSVAHAAFLLLATHNRPLIYIDITVYIVSSLLVWCIVATVFTEYSVKDYWWFPYVMSSIVVIVITLLDLSLNLYHYVMQEISLYNFYAEYVLIVIYVFLPIPNVLPPLFLGIIVTFCYVCYTYFIMKDNIDIEILVFTNIIHLFGINLIGVFFRLVRDITLRSSILVRFLYIKENVLSDEAQTQEQAIIDNMVPAFIAKKMGFDIQNRINYNSRKIQNDSVKTKARTGMFERYQNVSILFANIINYSFEMVNLDGNSAIEFLHYLYYRFHIISQQYNVQCIRLLGDYFIFAIGLSGSKKDHAKCSIDFGFRLIDEIREIREARNLNIDVRIGVHSGDVVGGLIGLEKFQYDIWSKDVDIAHYIESTGIPGRVHVSEITLLLLENDYNYEAGTEAARNDIMLQKWKINTFLIISLLDNVSLSHTWLHDESPLTKSNFEERKPSILQYNLQELVKKELDIVLYKIPVGDLIFNKIFQPCFKRKLKENALSEEPNKNKVTLFQMAFTDPNIERQFLMEPDGMIRYSIALSLIVCVLLYVIEILDKGKSYYYWIIVILIFILTVLFGVAWYKKCWIIFISKYANDKPRHWISLRIYNTSEKIQQTKFVRTVIYIFIIFVYSIILFVHVWDCNRDEFEVKVIESKLFSYEDTNLCFNPWVFSSSTTLIMGITILFTSIPFFLKSIVSVLLMFTYTIVVKYEYDYVFETSMSTNIYLDADNGHLLFVYVPLICFYLMARQAEFNRKVHFCWKSELLHKMEITHITDETISALLNNLLPLHLIDFYLAMYNNNKIYHEENEKVAIMIGSITNFDYNKVGLNMLNEIISEFDEVLVYYKVKWKVEKIRTVGWTYTAVCGLNMNRSDSVSASVTFQSRTESNGKLYFDIEDESNVVSERHNAEKENDDDIVVLVLAQLALDLMRTHYSLNRTSASSKNYKHQSDFGTIRIGMSYGKIMGGIVGYTAPQYVIWGEPINLAALMDSTGMAGRMQVTEETAFILRKYNINCTYRELRLKDRVDISTYIVDIDDSFNFERNSLQDLEEGLD